MDPFMKPETKVLPLSEGVWSIDQQMVRSFLIVGSTGALLVDTGATPCDLANLVKGITDRPLTVVHTHSDGDHTANDSQFSEIYMQPADLGHMRQVPEGVTYLPVSEGMTFDLGGRSLKVIEIPGHTPGSIALLDEANRILFSGDTVSHGPVFLFGRGRDITSYRSSLEKLKAMDSYDDIYPCHEACPVGREVIDELLCCVDGYLDGSLPITDGDMPMPPDAPPVGVCSCGSSGILVPPRA